MENYLTPENVCQLVPGMTKSNLAAMRVAGKGPRYYKPTPKTVVYKKTDVVEWVESTARDGGDGADAE